MIIFIGAMPGIAHSVEDGIIAVVNDEVITFKDLRDYIRQTYASLVAQGLPEDQVQEMMAELQANGLKQLIEDKLILSRANAIGIEVRDKLVDQRVEEIKAKYPSEQVFLDALVNNGANVTDLRDKILDQLKIKYVIDHEVKSKVFVNPQEVTEFYEENKDSFQKSRRVNLDSIYIAFIDGKEAARARANEAMALIKEGKGFEEVAKQYSDSSSIGVVEEGQFLPDIEKAVFSLTPGQVSDSVETDKGIFIFKLKGGSPPRWLNSKRSRTRSTICSTARNSRNVLSNGWASCTKRPMSRSSNKPIGITLGDPAGIGAEVTAKALANPTLRRAARFTIIGDECLFRKYFPVRYKNCAFIDVGCLRAGEFRIGRPSRRTGKASLAYLQTAIDLVKRGQLSALVTAPVCKEAIGKIIPSFHGHTEFLAGAFRARDIGMMFVSGTLRVLLVTRHIPLGQVSRAINADLVFRAIRSTDTALKKHFHLKKPLIGVCGLNPHAGEGGTLGREEIRHIIPAIKRACSAGIKVEGPFSADTIFIREIPSALTRFWPCTTTRG